MSDGWEKSLINLQCSASKVKVKVEVVEVVMMVVVVGNCELEIVFCQEEPRPSSINTESREVPRYLPPWAQLPWRQKDKAQVPSA